MHLTTFSDYALRLMMLAHSAGDRLVTIDETARRYRISKAHLMKVANLLTQSGFLEAVRGRGGGLKLARPGSEIRLGDLVSATEPDFALVECYRNGACPVTSYCRLPPLLDAALAAFLDTLNQHTLADIALARLPVEGLAVRRPAVESRKSKSALAG